MPTTKVGVSGSRIKGIDPYLFKPRTRSFFVGTTGSGKSTLAVTLLERYHEKYPRHLIFIIDPKQRFFPVEQLQQGDPGYPDSRIFPDGPSAINHGRRDGVSVVGDVITKWPTIREESDVVYVIQDDSAISSMFSEIYKHADVRRPILLYADESFDFMRGVRADPALRRLLQQGREMGVGCAIVNQRPVWVDKTFLTESTYLYVGRLGYPDDRKVMSEVVTDERVRDKLLTPLPMYTWMYVDQTVGRSKLFKLTGVR